MVWKKINNVLSVGTEDGSEIALIQSPSRSDNDVMEAIVKLIDDDQYNKIWNLVRISRNDRDDSLYIMRSTPNDLKNTHRFKMVMTLDYDTALHGVSYPKLPQIEYEDKKLHSLHSAATTCVLMVKAMIERLNITHYTVVFPSLMINQDSHTAELTCRFGRCKRNTLNVYIEEVSDDLEENQ